MNGVYAYNRDIWLPLAAALFVAALGVYTWRRRDVPARKPFLGASAFGSLLLLSIAFQTAAIVPAARIAWYKWQHAVQMPAVTEERAQAGGGSLAVTSSPGQGKQVTIIVPRAARAGNGVGS